MDDEPDIHRSCVGPSTPIEWTSGLATKTIFFSVGEPSGDQHAARLIAALHGTNKKTSVSRSGSATASPAEASQLFASGSREAPFGISGDLVAANGQAIRCRGFGGQAMRAAGCDLDLDLTGHAVVGLVEVLPKLRDFFRFADQAEAIFAAGGVDAVVLVDFPGFNWHIAKRARRHQIPVYYYCPPQLWAWGGWRTRKMRRLVDEVLAVLPVEVDYFQKHGIPSTWVGHPFFDAVADYPLDGNLMAHLQPTAGAPHRTVAVLPGSRDHEVHQNFPIMLEAIRRLQNDPAVQSSEPVRYAVAAYRDRHCLWCRQQLTEADADLPIDFFAGKTSEIIQAADCAMMVSGSVSLELMARGTPAAVVYRVGRLLHAVAKRLVKVDTITLPNLMSPRKVFPEFVSVGPVEPAVAFLHETMRAMLTDQYYRSRLQGELNSLTQRYGMPGASRRAAAEIRRLLAGTPSTRGRSIKSGEQQDAETVCYPPRLANGTRNEQTKTRRAA